MDKYGLTRAPMDFGSPKWGLGVKTNAYRLTKKMTGKGSTHKDVVVKLLFPDAVPALRLLPKSYKWARPLVDRYGKPDGVTWHHAACANCTADDVHRWHLSNGWSGFAYHFFVDKEGRVWRGRPENKLGGHALGASRWIGVCFEGDFEKEQMGVKQLAAGRALHRYLHAKYGVQDRKHRDMPGNSTSCPGRYFPYHTIVSTK